MMLNLLVILALLIALTIQRSAIIVKGGQDIPEFFDDEKNVYCVIIGGAIIVICLILSFVIYRVKSKNAFEGSLFQNLEEED